MANSFYEKAVKPYWKYAVATFIVFGTGMICGGCLDGQYKAKLKKENSKLTIEAKTAKEDLEIRVNQLNELKQLYNLSQESLNSSEKRNERYYNLLTKGAEASDKLSEALKNAASEIKVSK